MTYHEMVRERTAVRRRGDPPVAALSDELTISGQFIQSGTHADYGAERAAPEDWPVSPREVACDWLPFVRKQLQAIQSLPYGWDSYGAPSPDARLVGAARGLIECLAQAVDLPQPHVNPTRNGGVQFEWEAGGRYFELEIVAERAAEFYYCDDLAQVEETGDVFEEEPLGQIIDYIRRVGAPQ